MRGMKGGHYYKDDIRKLSWPPTENVQSAALMMSPPLGHAVEESTQVPRLRQYVCPHDVQQPFASYRDALPTAAWSATSMARDEPAWRLEKKERILQVGGKCSKLVSFFCRQSLCSAIKEREKYPHYVPMHLL